MSTRVFNTPKSDSVVHQFGRIAYVTQVLGTEFPVAEYPFPGCTDGFVSSDILRFAFEIDEYCLI